MMKTTCESVQLELQAYVAGMLPNSTSSAVKRHLEVCASCRADLAMVSRIGEELRNMDSVWNEDAETLDPALKARILSAIPEAAPGGTARVSRSPSRLRFAFAAVGVALIAGIIYYPRYMQSDKQSLSKEQYASVMSHTARSASGGGLPGGGAASPAGRPAAMGVAGSFSQDNEVEHKSSGNGFADGHKIAGPIQAFGSVARRSIAAAPATSLAFNATDMVAAREALRKVVSQMHATMAQTTTGSQNNLLSYSIRAPAGSTAQISARLVSLSHGVIKPQGTGRAKLPESGLAAQQSVSNAYAAAHGAQTRSSASPAATGSPKTEWAKTGAGSEISLASPTETILITIHYNPR